MSQEQEIIEGLGSAILNYTGNIISVIGFYSADRLKDWNNRIDCWQSKAIFNDPSILFDYSRIQDDALFIIKREDQEVERYLYKPFFKGIVKYKNQDKNTDKNKDTSRTITLRKSIFTKHYHIVYQEKTIRQCIVCNDITDVETQMGKLFPNYKLYNKNNKRILDGFNAIKGTIPKFAEQIQLELL